MPDSTRAVFQIVIAGSIDDVWREITRTDDVIPCFFNSRMDRNGDLPGANVRMRTKSGKFTGVVGQVLEWKPPQRFAHTFKFTRLNDPECKVIYDLRQVPEGVEFTLTIEDLPPGTMTAKQMMQGAKLIIHTLKSVIETGRPSFGVRMLFVLIRVMEPFTPKVCRSENWP